MKLYIALAVFLGLADSLRVPLQNNTAPRVEADEAVHQLRAKLTALASGLQKMLDSKSGYASTKIGPELKTYVSELHGVLQQTEHMNSTAALQKLEVAKASMAGLMKDLTSRKESLMKDEETQKDSLLLGVLMTRQKAPMAEQLEPLRSDDFAMLPVSKALLAKHDDKTPLFTQAAAYLDTHAAKGVKIIMKDATAQKASMEDTAARLRKFEDSMEKSLDSRAKQHADRVARLQSAIKKAKSKNDKNIMKSALKREERNFKKWSLMQKRNIGTMKSAIAAVLSGDTKAVDKAREALEQSMRALQDKNAGMLVLLSLGHRMLEHDCPYCAAQCVDKCHQEGKSYVQCMTDCADAGKGK